MKFRINLSKCTRSLSLSLDPSLLPCTHPGDVTKMPPLFLSSLCISLLSATIVACYIDLANKEYRIFKPDANIFFIFFLISRFNGPHVSQSGSREKKINPHKPSHLPFLILLSSFLFRYYQSVLVVFVFDGVARATTDQQK